MMRYVDYSEFVDSLNELEVSIPEDGHCLFTCLGMALFDSDDPMAWDPMRRWILELLSNDEQMQSILSKLPANREFHFDTLRSVVDCFDCYKSVCPLHLGHRICMIFYNSSCSPHLSKDYMFFTIPHPGNATS